MESKSSNCNQKHFIAGCVAGSFSVIATQPLDTIKTRCQLNERATIKQHAISIIRHEGCRALFRGVATPAITAGLYSAVKFQTFEASKRMISNFKSSRHSKPELSYAEIAIAGIMTGTVLSVIATPTELIKIVSQQNTSFESMTVRHELNEAMCIIKEHGIFNGLYRGFSITLCRAVPFYAMYFPPYSSMMNEWDPCKSTQIVPFISGCIAGMVSWTAVYPMDYFKTLHQSRQSKYNGFRATIQCGNIVAVRSMYTGLGATLLRCTPYNGVLFLCYETIKKTLA